MTLKNYLKLLFHVIVTMLILVVPVVTLCVLLFNKIPDWSIVALGVISGFITMFPALKYMIFIVNKCDIFEDMF